MKKLLPIFFLFLLFGSPSFGQSSSDPLLSTWKINSTDETGYDGITANVQKVQYSTSYVYISSTGVPSFNIGPWKEPNVAEEQDFVLKFPRSPSENTGTHDSTKLGAIGFTIYGTAIYNAEANGSYNDKGYWHEDAVVGEASTFDTVYGHPSAQGVYHFHEYPHDVYTTDDTEHSPIIGWAFDGYPIYGPYGYANTDGTGGITRMESSYQLRNITKRTTLPDGTKLDSSDYGPAVSSTYPLGHFVEDYHYVDSSGDLDEYNGRYCVTPEYPNGIYAYFATIDSDGTRAYPYFVGPEYYGNIVKANIKTGGHVTIDETVTDYHSPTAVNSDKQNTPLKFALMQNYPNPFNPTTVIKYEIPNSSHVTLKVYDILGKEVATLVNKNEQAGSYSVHFGVGSLQLASGIYLYKLQAGNYTSVKKLVLLK